MIELNGGDMEQLAGFHTGYNGKKERGVWATFTSGDKLFLVLVLVSLLSAVVTLFILLSPILNAALEIMGLHYPQWIEWTNQIMVGDRGLVVAAAFGLIALLFALLARFRIRRTWSVYAEAGCPQCHEHELIRVRRYRRDRVLSFFGVPVRRYSCRNCTWHGARLAGYRYAKKVDAMEGFEVEEVKDGMSGELSESINEAVGETEVLPLPAPLPAVEIMMTDVGLEVAPEMSTQKASARSFEFVETKVIADAVNEEEMASEVMDAETNEDPELDDGPANGASGEAVVDTPVEYSAENNEVQAELAEEMVDSNDGSETISDDDEFARLCFEVAQARK